jgi:hypothetical protein
VAGIVIASLVAAAPAHAIEAHIDGETLQLEGTDVGESFGVENGLSGWWNVRSSSPIEAGPGCEIFNDSAFLRLRCPSAGITAIDADAGPGNDVFSIQTNLTPMPGSMTAVMGDGDDNIADPMTSGSSGFGLGPGDDRVVVHTERVGTLDIDAGPGDDNFEGGLDGDVLRGGDGDDRIRGHAGNDRIDGGGGHDTIDSDQGNDTVGGDDGNDILAGGAGSDQLTGGAGEDSVAADHGLDFFAGTIFPPQDPAGDDSIYVDDGGEADEIRCGGGNDFVESDSADYVPNASELAACETIDNGQPAPGPQPSTGPQPTAGQQPGAGQPPAGPAGGADDLAPLIADLTKAVQRIAQALRGKFTATISTNEAGTWKVQVFGRGPLASAARKALLATRSVTIDGPGDWRIKMPFKASAKKRLKRVRVARLQVRSTFTDTSGNTTTTTRKVRLRK